jgi:hypothetical protein
VAVALDSLPIAELLRAGVWEFDTDQTTHDETRVLPVTPLPAKSLEGRFAVANVVLAAGAVLPAKLGNVDVNNARRTRLLLALSVLLPSGEWFHLARHFDHNYVEYGPGALAAALRLPLDQVFPIGYDLSNLLFGDAASVVGSVPAVPVERITRGDAIRLAVEGAAL